MNDEDELARPLDVDLSAWQPPPPPGGIADAAIARMRAPANVAAVETDQPRARRWLWIGAGAVVLAAATVLLAVFGVTRGPGSGRGEVTAEKAALLDLGASSAAIDPGAHVIWERRNYRITAEQRRGVATWSVDDDDILLIDAGATVASVEATGASLRVEVHMNRADAKVFGASALTAAAVAAVTVIVYEGHVKVTSKGQTVQVVPGTTVEVDADGLPREQLNVGASPEVRALEERVAELEARLAEEDDEHDDSDDDLTADDPPLDYQLYGLVDDELDRVMRVVRAVHPEAMECIDKDRSFSGTIRVKAAIDRSGRVKTIDASPKNDVAQCVNDIIVAAPWPPTKNPWGLESGYAFEVCDEVACVLDNYAKPCCAKFKRMPVKTDDTTPESLDRAMISEAMARIRGRVERCGIRAKYSGTVKARVKVAADGKVTKADFEPPDAPVVECMRGAVETLKFRETQQGGAFAYPYRFDFGPSKSPPSTQTAACQDPNAFNPFDDRPACKPPVACDAGALLKHGVDAFAMNNMSRAHSYFSEAYACKASVDVAQRAYIAACGMKSVANARKWWRRMVGAQQRAVISICPRYGITNDDVQN